SIALFPTDTYPRTKQNSRRIPSHTTTNATSRSATATLRQERAMGWSGRVRTTGRVAQRQDFGAISVHLLDAFRSLFFTERARCSEPVWRDILSLARPGRPKGPAGRPGRIAYRHPSARDTIEAGDGALQAPADSLRSRPCQRADSARRANA